MNYVIDKVFIVKNIFRGIEKLVDIIFLKLIFYLDVKLNIYSYNVDKVN